MEAVPENPSTRVEYKVSEDEINHAEDIKRGMMEGKEDKELIGRIKINIEELRGWVSANGKKKEPALPPNVRKISSKVSLEDESLYFRWAEKDVPDPFMFWAIDTINDPIRYEESNGLVLRVIKDEEFRLVIFDVHYPLKDQEGLLELGTTIIEKADSSGHIVTTFPPRVLSEISGYELRLADTNFKQALNRVNNPRSEMGPPTFRGLS